MTRPIKPKASRATERFYRVAFDSGCLFRTLGIDRIISLYH